MRWYDWRRWRLGFYWAAKAQTQKASGIQQCPVTGRSTSFSLTVAKQGAPWSPREVDLMRWYDWRRWRLAHSSTCRAEKVVQTGFTWHRLGLGFYWATKT